MKVAKINKTPDLCVSGLIYEMSVFMSSPSLGCCKELLDSERNQLLQVSLAAMNAIIHADCHHGEACDSLIALEEYSVSRTFLRGEEMMTELLPWRIALAVAWPGKRACQGPLLEEIWMWKAR